MFTSRVSSASWASPAGWLPVSCLLTAALSALPCGCAGPETDVSLPQTRVYWNELTFKGEGLYFVGMDGLSQRDGSMSMRPVDSTLTFRFLIFNGTRHAVALSHVGTEDVAPATWELTPSFPAGYSSLILPEANKTLPFPSTAGWPIGATILRPTERLQLGDELPLHRSAGVSIPIHLSNAQAAESYRVTILYHLHVWVIDGCAWLADPAKIPVKVRLIKDAGDQ